MLPKFRKRASEAASSSFFVGMLLLCACVGDASASKATPLGLCSDQKIEYRSGALKSGGKVIKVDRFQPRERGKFPAIILIHSSAGLLTQAGRGMPLEENFGEKQIACAGYVSLLVHYFDRSGILSTGDQKFMEQQAPMWLETLDQAIDYASLLPNVDARRIGLVGESLGGYLALTLGMHDRRIKVISEYSGGIRLRQSDDPRRLPPVLIQHGGADTIVPLTEAKNLADVLSRAGVPYKMRIYVGLEHYLNTQTRSEAEALTIAFLNDHLKQEKIHLPATLLK
jgi:carboxymethylenebutenolidase